MSPESLSSSARIGLTTGRGGAAAASSLGTRLLVTVPSLRVLPTDEVMARGRGVALVLRKGPVPA